MSDLASNCNVSITDETPIAGSKLTLRWEKDTDSGFIPVNQGVFNLYPNNSAIKVSVTSGSLSSPVSRAKEITEFIIFSGTNSQTTGFPSPTGLTITPQGGFLDIEGNSTSVSFTYDADTNQIVATKKVYGVIKVVYTVSFRQYILTFVGQCPISDLQFQDTPYFEQALLLAILDVDDEISVGSLVAVNNDSRCFGLSGFVAGTAPVPGSPLIEVPKFFFEEELQELRTAPLIPNDPVTIVRCYPNVGQSFILLSNDTNKFFTTKAKLDERTEEELIFNNTSRMVLKFPEVEITAAVLSTGKVINQFGFLVDGFIQLPGTKVNIVEWENTGRPIFTGKQREVDCGEIVITDAGKNEMAIQGTVLVDYEATYIEVTYHHTITLEPADPADLDDKDKHFADRDVLVAKKTGIGSANSIVGTFVIRRWKIAEKEID